MPPVIYVASKYRPGGTSKGRTAEEQAERLAEKAQRLADRAAKRTAKRNEDSARTEIQAYHAARRAKMGAHSLSKVLREDPDAPRAETVRQSKFMILRDMTAQNALMELLEDGCIPLLDAAESVGITSNSLMEALRMDLGHLSPEDIGAFKAFRQRLTRSAATGTVKTIKEIKAHIDAARGKLLLDLLGRTNPRMSPKIHVGVQMEMGNYVEAALRVLPPEWFEKLMVECAAIDVVGEKLTAYVPTIDERVAGHYPLELEA